MNFELTEAQREAQQRFRQFVDAEIAPFADEFDQEERFPTSLVQRMAALGYLGGWLPVTWGGQGMDPITYGLLNREIGRGCSSARSLITVHGMVAHAVLRWGSRTLKEQWLPLLASGAKIGAFGLTEPNVGSDAKSVETSAIECGDYYVLNGTKLWNTFGQLADVYLICAQWNGQPTAFLLERDNPGLTVRPVKGILGTRGSMLAELTLQDCRVPAGNLVGKKGFGFTHVASACLDHGRYCVAWGCVGIIAACLEASVNYSNCRHQFGVALREHALIRQMISEMTVKLQCAELMCLKAGFLRETADPSAITQTMLAARPPSNCVWLRNVELFSMRRMSADSVTVHGR